jgi:arginyl-tRNA synthetase
VPDPALITPIVEAIRGVAASLDPALRIDLSAPANPEHGDLATPVAMALAKAARRSPREIAAEIAAALEPLDIVERVEVAGPGFVNVTLAPSWFAGAAGAVAAAGGAYGAGQAAPAERIHLEFVSANPTGPLHVGHARHAAFGDSLGRILAFAGHSVHREYYVNDYGRQIELFGLSVKARLDQLHGVDTEVPDDGYHGEYIVDIAREIGESDLDAAALGAIAEDLMLRRIQADLERFRVRFDGFFSETSLHEASRVAEGIDRLLTAGDAYEQDGAIWFRTTAYGDEKDRVIRRADGSTTYIAPDVAYHLDKAARGFDRLINVLGADHHGYVQRLRAVLAAGGHDPEMLEVPLIQLVSLVEGGEEKRMSKRAGTVVALSDLIDDIGVDAARFFLVQRANETAFDLDLAVAREQSRENPVYYAQYVHARACNVLERVDEAPAPATPPSVEPAERALVLRLGDWPETVAEAERRRAPHRVVAYLIDLARDFHLFYEHCRVYDAPDDLKPFRVDLTRAARGVIALGLDLLGVEAPQRM